MFSRPRATVRAMPFSTHSSGIYTPKELMEMDWLEECVEGELPSYDELDAKTRSLLNVNGLDIVKGTPQ